MEIRLLESAKEDLREGWSFYEKTLADSAIIFLIAYKPTYDH